MENVWKINNGRWNHWGLVNRKHGYLEDNLQRLTKHVVLMKSKVKKIVVA